MPADPPGASIVLVGAPGAGKSTVGQALAARLGLPFRDVDTEIEEQVGKSVAEIFADDGEAVFRAHEQRLTAELLREPGVLALGGGAVLTEATRAALAGHQVVWLRVSAGEAAKRVGLTEARPLLLGNVRGRLVQLLAARTPLYQEVATTAVDTDGRDPESIVTALLAEGLPTVIPPTEIAVSADRPYEVVVGHGLGSRLPAALGPGVRRVALVHPTPLADRAAALTAELQRPDLEVLSLEVPAGEEAKTAAVAAGCWARLGEAGFTRSDVVVGLGGGSTTDLAGFVAGTWLRGVRLVLLPTTLLAMVDAAVGGKTGINTAAGKNLVGVFHEPAEVLCDLDELATLPAAELRSGLAEVAKCGFIADPEILRLLENTTAALDPASPVLRELVERAVRVKAAVVSADLREATSTGRRVGRELLNYGHTLGHAIERREGYRWRHGEAISVGMVFVAELARRAGLLDEETAERHRTVLSRLGLPVTYAPDAFDELLATMAVDKKSRGNALRFVVLEGIAAAAILEAPAPELLRDAYAAVSRR